MAFGAILQALAAGAGGAGQGIRAFQDDWTQHQDLLASERYQRGVLADRAADRRATAEYRRDTLAQDAAQARATAARQERELGFEASRVAVAEKNAETARLREMRLSGPTERLDDNPISEPMRNRMQRATSALGELDPETGLRMSDDDLDTYAQRRGFRSFDDMVAGARGEPYSEPTASFGPQAPGSGDYRTAPGYEPPMGMGLDLPSLSGMPADATRVPQPSAGGLLTADDLARIRAARGR